MFWMWRGGFPSNDVLRQFLADAHMSLFSPMSRSSQRLPESTNGLIAAANCFNFQPLPQSFFETVSELWGQWFCSETHGHPGGPVACWSPLPSPGSPQRPPSALGEPVCTWKERARTSSPLLLQAGGQDWLNIFPMSKAFCTIFTVSKRPETWAQTRPACCLVPTGPLVQGPQRRLPRERASSPCLTSPGPGFVSSRGSWPHTTWPGPWVIPRTTAPCSSHAQAPTCVFSRCRFPVFEGPSPPRGPGRLSWNHLHVRTALNMTPGLEDVASEAGTSKSDGNDASCDLGSALLLANPGAGEGRLRCPVLAGPASAQAEASRAASADPARLGGPGGLHTTLPPTENGEQSAFSSQPRFTLPSSSLQDSD
uniref:Uncharacterized protein n=1 Tax=Rousettus aegyptiacus TaxID=9407 RepID=A0A7J8DIA9_ROUAE|nr:hypothetical protein HJG63_008713 [Rousettus aegyptiacus]